MYDNVIIQRMDGNYLPNFFREQNVLGKIKIENALNSLNWVVGAFIFILIPTYIFAHLAISILLTIIFATFLGVYVYCYIYMMKNIPEALRSESYLLKKQEMEMFGSSTKLFNYEKLEKETLIERPAPESEVL